MVHASIELGVRKDPAFQLIHWPAIRDNGWTEHGQQKKIPGALNLRDPHLIQLRAGHSRGDGAPFILKHAGDQLFILTKEIDRNTEPFTSASERRTIKQKFEHYEEIFARNLYQTHYGFPNSIVLFVTISESRMNSMVTFAEETIGRCPWLVFYHWKDWYNERSYPPPTDYIFTRSRQACEFSGLQTMRVQALVGMPVRSSPTGLSSSARQAISSSPSLSPARSISHSSMAR